MDAICRRIRNQFTDYLDRTLPFKNREEFETHLTTCKSCQNVLEMTETLVSTCHQMKEEQVPAGFEARWRERLEVERQGKKIHQPIRWFKDFSLALRPATVWVSTGVAFFIVMTTLYFTIGLPTKAPVQQISSSIPAHVQPVRLHLDKNHTLRIWFDAKQPVDEVRFHIELPDGIVLIDADQMTPVQQIQWIGSLKKGRNLISLPIRGASKGQWTVKASIEKGSTRKEKSIDLLVNGI